MTDRFARTLLVAASAAWVIAAIVNLVTAPTLGHDEAAFVLVARGDVPTWLYRSRGVVTLAEWGLALGGADWQLRLGTTLIALGLIPAVFAVGRAAFDARTGAWAAAVVAGAYPIALRSAQLLGDVPATVGLLAGVAAIAGELRHDAGPRWRVTLAAPAFAAAFYLRYASAPVIAIAVAAAVVLGWRSILRRPLPVLVTAVLFVALLIPHFQQSLGETGRLLGILRWSSGVPRRAYWGEGLVTYATSNPFTYYGVLVAPAMVAALVGLARWFRDRAAWFVALVAFGQLIAIGTESHGQPRYVFAAAALLTVLGVAALQRLGRPRIALAAVTAAWLGSVIAIVVVNRLVTDNRQTVLAAAHAITTDHRAPGCVIIAVVVPQLQWHTGCDGLPSARELPPDPGPSVERYVVSTPYGVLDGVAYAAAHGLTATELPTGHPQARVWRLR